jgi:uncharacterized protein YbjT (DUF2867 family)
MSDLVVGGTGRVGSAVVEGLLAQGREVRVLTRSPERARGLPAAAGAVVGDLLEPRSYPAAFAGAERVFLVNAISQSELQEGLAAVNEALQAGVRHLVYLSIHDVEQGPHVPHFAAKIAIEAAIRASGVPFTILRPNNFFQNDLWFKDAILGYGIYPQPLGGVGLSRVDVRDIAQAAVNVMTQPGHAGRSYALVGPEAVTGQDVARAYAEALGREVRYGGDDLNAWEQLMLTLLPAWMVYDFKLMYALFQRNGLRASEDDLRDTHEVLGRPPLAFGGFVRETAAAWTSVPVPLPAPQR